MSIDAKDIFIANHYIEPNGVGYNPRRKDGQYNTKRFINSFDYSLDLMKLAEIYYKKYRNTNFTFHEFGKEYTPHVINVTFKYANRAYNQIRNGTYVKFGYDFNRIQFADGISLNSDGDLVGIETGVRVDNPLPEKLLAPYFGVRTKTDEETGQEYTEYCVVKQPATLNSRADLRNNLYQNGFWCDGIHFVRMKRSSGSARTGKCLFVNEVLYPAMKKWQLCGLTIEEGQQIDLAALEAYISLPTSSIIDTIEIKPENILVIDDYDSIFDEEVMATRAVNGRLETKREKATIKNSIWDGQSLMDRSLFGPYKDKGMLLLRNLFFKSCCFNANLQEFFADHGITKVEQLAGKTMAKDIRDIKMITTPSSIKFMKFGKLEDWLHTIDSEFGVVKYEKPTHYFDGRLVQTHYQLINTLQLTKQEMVDFLQPSLDFARLLRTDPDAVKLFIKYPEDKVYENKPMYSKNDVVYNMLCVNPGVSKTKYYRDFLDDLMRAFYKNIKKGHVLVNGNYSTLLGNPIEMLYASIGKFDGQSQIGVGNVHSKRFPYDYDLLGSRSPHTSSGNILLVRNTANALVDKYLNITNEIVCINSIGENILQRLNGADYDSDTVLLTDNPHLIAAAKRNYDRFLVPTNFVAARKKTRYYTAEHLSDLDIKTSVNKIGEIINLAQVLTSMYWDRIAGGASHEDVENIYTDICTLSVLSNLEIDKAKREYEVDSTRELSLMRKKYEAQMTDSSNKKIMPQFFSHIERQKGYYNPAKKAYNKHDTSMDYLQTIINGFRIRNGDKRRPEPFSRILNEELFYAYRVNGAQANEIIQRLNDYLDEIKTIYAGTSDNEDKRNEARVVKEKLFAEISSEKIGYSTMFWLLTIIDDEEHKRIKNLLLEILFTTCGKSFESAVMDSHCDVYYYEMVPPDTDGAVEIYGEKYKKMQK